MSAADISNTTDLNKVHYIREALPIIEYNMVFGKFGQEDEMPRGDGTSFEWIRFTKLDSDSNYTTNATGNSPSWFPTTPADTVVTVTPDYVFGPGYEWNTAREYTSWTDLPKAARKNISVQAAEVLEKRVRDVLVTGSNVVYANGKTARADLTTADTLDMADIFRAVEELENSGAKPMAKTGTYCAVISPNTKRALLSDSTFRDLVEHNHAEQVMKGKIGVIDNVEFYVSPLAPYVANSGSASSVSKVHQTLIFAEGAYGVAKIMFDNFDIIYTAPGNGKGQGAHGDEWANKHKLTWKAAFKAVILNDDWMVRLESANIA